MARRTCITIMCFPLMVLLCLSAAATVSADPSSDPNSETVPSIEDVSAIVRPYEQVENWPRV